MDRFIVLFSVLMMSVSSSVLKYHSIIIPDGNIDSEHAKSGVDLADGSREYFSNPRFRRQDHVLPLNLNPDKVDSSFIQKRSDEFHHNIIKRSRGWDSYTGSKSGGKGDYFSSNRKGKNYDYDTYNGYNNNNYGQQLYSSSGYGQPSTYGQSGYGESGIYEQSGYGHLGYNGYHNHHHDFDPYYRHTPVTSYGFPSISNYGDPDYHSQIPKQSEVVGINAGDEPSKSPGLIPDFPYAGLASEAFGNVANNGLIGNGGLERPVDLRLRPASQSGNNNIQKDNYYFSAQADPECLKSCFTTEEYTPVCGTDAKEYKNIGKLNCMKTCGKRVEVSRFGVCYVPPVKSPQTLQGQNLPVPCGSPAHIPFTTLSGISPTISSSKVSLEDSSSEVTSAVEPSEISSSNSQASLPNDSSEISSTDVLSETSTPNAPFEESTADVPPETSTADTQSEASVDGPSEAPPVDAPVEVSLTNETSETSQTDESISIAEPSGISPAETPSEVSPADAPNKISPVDALTEMSPNEISFRSPESARKGLRKTRDLITGAPLFILTSETPITSTTTSPAYNLCMRNCVSTPEQNVLCGTDGQDYANQGRLDCAKGCGKDVEVAFTGTCIDSTVLSRQK